MIKLRFETLQNMLFFFFFLFKLRGQQFPGGRDSTEDLVNRPLQKRERTGKEYGCFPFV